MLSTSQSEDGWVASLSTAERARFMALLANSLTVAMRVLCHGDGPCEQVVERLRQLNEALHQVTGYLSHSRTGIENVQFLPRVVASVLELQNASALQQAE